MTPEHEIESDSFDRGIIPAETQARMDREGENYKHTASDEEPDTESIDVTAGQTVSNEGLANNYAIEPEMYIDEPGDLKDQQ
ncbi:MAG: hypothetical protein DCF15_20525 [Phormidesmis priestleyi]|uniref:Uncharacterized protein n=1 Tax=Phormidesmis priestleyi TaxID=268141 RepID=A0A2W4WSU7_9CYAN|nr:MAG: hypothetical protein DCF15_20525 [Phormidesmis priestleyi]